MVATVTELRSTSAAVDYYEKDGYYAKNDPEHRRASFWHGEAASAAGLRGHVHPKRFESVLSGQVPGADVRLGRKRDGEHVHRPGWDITLSAPKSVSLEALVRGDRRVIRAHDQAVYETLDWIEKELLETRGWDPETQKRPRIAAHGMAVAGFRHLTSPGSRPPAPYPLHPGQHDADRVGGLAERGADPDPAEREADRRLLPQRACVAAGGAGLRGRAEAHRAGAGIRARGLRPGLSRRVLGAKARDSPVSQRTEPSLYGGGYADGGAAHAQAQDGCGPCRAGARYGGSGP